MIKIKVNVSISGFTQEHYFTLRLFLICTLYLTPPYSSLQAAKLSIIHILYLNLIIIQVFCYHFPYKANISSQHYYITITSVSQSLNIIYCSYQVTDNPCAPSKQVLVGLIFFFWQVLLLFTAEKLMVNVFFSFNQTSIIYCFLS